jgi:hypothetical protein
MEVKGVALKNSFDWVVEQHGKESWKKIIEDIPKDSQQYISDGIIFSSEWYPFKVFIDINKAIINKYGNGNHKIIYEIAKNGAIKNMNSIYKIFMKIASPAYVTKKAAAIYSQFYTFGQMKVHTSEPTRVVLHLEGVHNEPIFFERISGYITGVLTLTKVKNLKLTYRYDEKGKSATFDANWE